MMDRFVILELIFVLFFQLAADSPLKPHWELFKAKYNKRYSPLEEFKRQLIFEENLLKIFVHNMAAELGNASYTMGINRFTDMSHEEFINTMNGYASWKRKAPKNISYKYSSDVVENMILPDVVDWRTKGYVTPVKDQQGCGSCWAFSATGSLEGQHFKATGRLVSLSEQNLVDCSWREGNEGCSGGLMDNAFEYIMNRTGIDTELSYPYTAEDHQCHYSKRHVGASCKGYVDIQPGTEDRLQLAVATVGPISVAIDASQDGFQHYKSGVYNDRRCGNTMSDIDHGVLVVGYGVLKGRDYWIVKNSWSEEWGDKGYILMSRNKGNQCGIANEASYPLV